MTAIRQSLLAAIVMAGILLAASRPALAQSSFAELAAAGQAALGRVESPAIAGNTHLTQGQIGAFKYEDPFPTSGDHNPRPVASRFYTEPVAPTSLVHSLEHGNIVVYYGKIAPSAIGSFLKWGRQFRGAWDGLIIVPHPQLSGGELVLTAWGKRLRLAQFDKAAAAAFIDAFAGRGPENRVR